MKLKTPQEQLTEDSSAIVENDDAGWDRRAEVRARMKFVSPFKVLANTCLRVDLSVLLLLLLGLTVFQLDRMNIGSALTGNFARDISVTQNTINLGNQLMFLGIVLLEIPSNMLLQRIGPRKWITAQVFTFGLIATLQIFVRNRAGFLVSRSLLGLAEAGYIPGAIYTLSTWYTRRELARRVAVLFFGMFGGNAISPLLGAGILRLDGKRGLSGWQWIFLIEGVWTIFISLLLFLMLPGSPDDPQPLMRKGFFRFSEEEKFTLRKRLERDGKEKKKGAQGKNIPLKVVWRTLKNYCRWLHYLATACVFSTWSPLTTYTPSIIMSLGFDRVKANAIAAIGAFLALPVVFFFAWISDRTGKRGLAVILAIACYLVALIVTRTVQPHVVGRWSHVGLWTAVNAFAVGYHPVHNTWVQLNCREPTERSVAIAAISGLMAGTQIFRSGDGPL
ncbi:major facilitator superfamily domain-containing protein [Thermoascus aurantiacus ATCC 26904]